MPPSPVQRFYKFHAAIYDWTRWAFLFGRRDAIDALDIGPSHSVLEIGCGTGLNFSLITRRLDPSTGQLCGVDFSEDMLDRAARRVRRKGWTHVELVRADATKLDLGRRFDRVFFCYSLTMIPNWQAAIRRAVEHLAPGGRLCVLDFGSFRSLGPLGGVPRWWLRLNHVETTRPLIPSMRDALSTLQIRRARGDYRFVAVGER